MRVIKDVLTTTQTFPNVVLTIGSFDGVHRGHEAMIAAVREAALTSNGTAAVMTLHPHPRQFFLPHHPPNLLTNLEQKVELLEALGVDVLYVLPFDASVACLEREEFLETVILQRCQARHLVIGHDFTFGCKAKGDFAFLQAAAPRHEFTVQQVPALSIDGERVSSTLIRELIQRGELDRVEKFLARRYAVAGEVVACRGLGAQLGFPTANLRPGPYAVPAHGIYAAEAIIDGIGFVAAVNVGYAPTLQHHEPMIEAHLLDFDGDLVGKEMRVMFHHRLRGEKKFDSVDELVVAIDADVLAVRRYFADKDE